MPGTLRRRARHLLAAGDELEAIGPLLTASRALVESGLLVEAGQMLDERDRAIDRLPAERARIARIESLLARAYLSRAGLVFLAPSGRGEQALDLIRQARSMAEGGESKELLAAVLLEQGRIEGTVAQFQQSLETLEAADQLFVQLGDLRSRADCARATGVNKKFLGKLEEAAECFEFALDVYETFDDSYGIAVSRLNLARQGTLSGGYERAGRHAVAGLVQARRLGFNSLVADYLNQLGEIARLSGDLAEAEGFYREAIEAGTLVANSPNNCLYRMNLGLTMAAAGRYSDARRSYEEAKPDVERNHPAGLPLVTTFLLPCLAAEGDWLEWDQALGRASELLESIGIVDPDIAHCLEQAAVLARDAGHDRRAQGAWSQALKQWKAIGDAGQVERVEALVRAAGSS